MSLITAKEQRALITFVEKALSPLEKRIKLVVVENIVCILRRCPTAALDFWYAALKQSLQVNRFSAWKFCALLHKLLRDSDDEMVSESIRRERSLGDIYEYWRGGQHQYDTVATSIAHYSYALLLKLQFHRNYTFLKGDLRVKDDRPWNLNICFQLVPDIFDMLRAFGHALQALFADLQQHKLPPQSKQAQCRLMAVNSMVLECDSLYAHSVTALRILVSELTMDDVAALCQRHLDIHSELRHLSVLCGIQFKIPPAPESFFGPRINHLYPQMPYATAPPLEYD